jgi:signal transduction histidine kinase/response regulator RpfG family c-di-GMP phosphodiesterase
LLMYEILLYPVKDESGLTTGVSFSGRNITDRIKQEEALREARDKAEKATNAKSEFLAVMSHEIRTPLNGLIGMSDLLNTTHLNDQQKEFVDVIRLSGETLLQLISDILDFSKIEANKMQLEYAPFRVEEVVTEALTILSGKGKEKNLKLIPLVHDDVPAFIIGDKARLRQIIMNLVGNAIKFTEVGSVTVELKKLKESHGEVTLEFSVTDTGIGIEKEAAERLFTAFTQADPSTYRKYGGSGLGLTICKMLVDLMGGKIWVESKVGKGSTFSFSFLTRIVDSNEVYQDGSEDLDEAVRPLAEIENASGPDRKPVKILLAEDNDINRLLAGKLFERLGYSIDTVTNGKEAYDAVKEGSYDLVFMDVQMPEWTGLEASQHIRSDLPSAKQPIIIAMTAFAGDDDKELCTKAGMDDYLSKPINMDDIEKMILKWSGVNKSQTFEDNMKRKTELQEKETPLINQTAIQRLMDIGKQTDPGFLQQVLDMFVKQAPLDIKNIVQGFESGDFALMWKTAHKLKGTCLNIGAQRLAETCKEIERKGRNLENAGLLGLCMQLDKEYNATIIELKNLFHYN